MPFSVAGWAADGAASLIHKYTPFTATSNSYWAPNATTALGPVCSPNYEPQGVRRCRCRSLCNLLCALLPSSHPPLPSLRDHVHPLVNTTRWDRYISYLHSLVTELATQYQPDAYWFDCSNSPPRTDTFLDAVLPNMRCARTPLCCAAVADLPAAAPNGARLILVLPFEILHQQRQSRGRGCDPKRCAA